MKMATAEVVVARGSIVSSQNRQSLDGMTTALDELLPRLVGPGTGNMAPTMSRLDMMAAAMAREAARGPQATALLITIATDVEVPALKDVRTQNPPSISPGDTE